MVPGDDDANLKMQIHYVKQWQVMYMIISIMISISILLSKDNDIFIL